MVVDLDLRIAGELRLDALQVLLGGGDALARDLEADMRDSSSLAAGANLRSARSFWRSKSRLGIDCWLSAALMSSRLVRHCARSPRISARCDLDVGFDLGKRQPIRRVVEPKSSWPRETRWFSRTGDLDDRAAELGGDIDPVALHIGVVGLDVAAGASQKNSAAGGSEERQRPHEQAHEDAAADARPTRGGNRNRRCQRLRLLSVHSSTYGLPSRSDRQPAAGHG